MQGWIYEATFDNKYRFVLGEPGKRNLVCFGINPSTAAPGDLDNTLRSVTRIMKNNNYDGWIMLNIYAQRATDPNDLHLECDGSIHKLNLKHIEQVLTKYGSCDLWAAWGTLIRKREYLKQCLRDIYGITGPEKWITFGSRSKQGHPHHPLYLNQNSGSEKFDIEDYILKL